MLVKAVDKQLLLECWTCVDGGAGFKCLERSAIKHKLASLFLNVTCLQTICLERLGESLAHFVPGCGEGVAAKKYLLRSAALLFSALVLREPTTVPSWVPHAFPGLPRKLAALSFQASRLLSSPSFAGAPRELNYCAAR